MRSRPERLRTVAALVLSLSLGCPPAVASRFDLKLSGGAAWVEGGDINRLIRGRRDYYLDRKGPGFDVSYGLRELRLAGEFQAELSYRFSPSWSIALATGYVSGATSGDVSILFSETRLYAISATESGVVSVEEATNESPRHELAAIPILLTLGRSLRLGDRFDLHLGAGGGLYFGRYSRREEYTYRLDWSDTQDVSGAPVQNIDRYSSKGTFQQNVSGAGFGLHGLVGVEWKVSASVAFVLEVAGRWAAIGDWHGDTKDSYQWSEIWGPGGVFSGGGRVAESAEGKLWRIEPSGEGDSPSYPRLVVSETAPVSSTSSDIRPARISLSGAVARIGVRLRLGERE